MATLAEIPRHLSFKFMDEWAELQAFREQFPADLPHAAVLRRCLVAGVKVLVAELPAAQRAQVQRRAKELAGSGD
jgi:hypothetical protein